MPARLLLVPHAHELKHQDIFISFELLYFIFDTEFANLEHRLSGRHHGPRVTRATSVARRRAAAVDVSQHVLPATAKIVVCECPFIGIDLPESVRVQLSNK